MCPHADARAAKIFARSHAVGFLGTLEGILRGLKEGHRRIGFQTVEEGPINFEFWGTRWRSSADDARMEIGKCEDAELLKRLESLEYEWVAFVAANSAEPPAEPEQAATTKAAPSKRPPGRPVGSGSLNPLDAPLLEEMREATLENPSLSPTSAARRVVDRAAGGGTEDSKIKRLTQRYLEKFGTETMPHAAD